MTIQVYNDLQAIDRMRDGLCPECGNEAETHGTGNEFWLPRPHDCSLLPHGVTERIQYQRKLDLESGIR